MPHFVDFSTSTLGVFEKGKHNVHILKTFTYETLS